MLMIYFVEWKKFKRLYKGYQLVMSRVLDYNIVTSLEKAQLYMMEIKSFRRFCLMNKQLQMKKKSKWKVRYTVLFVLWLCWLFSFLD